MIINDGGPKILLGVTGVGAVTSMLDIVNTLVQIGAGAMAMVSGYFAARYYLKKYRE